MGRACRLLLLDIAQLLPGHSGIQGRFYKEVWIWRLSPFLGVSQLGPHLKHNKSRSLTHGNADSNNWLSMTGLGFVMEFMLRLAGPLYFPFFLVFCQFGMLPLFSGQPADIVFAGTIWNVSTAFLDISDQDPFYGYGFAFPVSIFVYTYVR
jgi:hypothetical protein